MCSGFGLRTMSSATGGYSPLSYHCGSVWPHDTAIAIHGLVRRGFAGQAATLAEGLVAAGAAFDGRLPELFGGFDRADIAVPVPYPAACRPQAWSAASAVTILQAFLGLEADVPGGVLRVSPPGGGRGGDGVRAAGRRTGVARDGDLRWSRAGRGRR
jgi:glycogen debranching enzyme